MFFFYLQRYGLDDLLELMNLADGKLITVSHIHSLTILIPRKARPKAGRLSLRIGLENKITHTKKNPNRI